MPAIPKKDFCLFLSPDGQDNALYTIKGTNAKLSRRQKWSM